MVECQHISCTDDATERVAVEEIRGMEYLCEDHAHMNPDGTPVDGYEPNDPDKFTSATA